MKRTEIGNPSIKILAHLIQPTTLILLQEALMPARQLTGLSQRRIPVNAWSTRPACIYYKPDSASTIPSLSLQITTISPGQATHVLSPTSTLYSGTLPTSSSSIPPPQSINHHTIVPPLTHMPTASINPYTPSTSFPKSSTPQPYPLPNHESQPSS